MDVQTSSPLQQPSNAVSRSRAGVDPFRKSQLKESELLLGVCCSRHLHCIQPDNDPSPYLQSDSLSVASDLLQEIAPLNIPTEPLFEFQNKPEIDLLAQVNIKKKRYEKIILEHEKEEEIQKKKKMLQKLSEEAKKRLEKCKKIPKPHSAEWGHSLFVLTVEKENDEKVVQKEEDRDKKEGEKKKIEMKPIDQRIAQYKQEQQLKKMKSTEALKRPPRQNVNLEQCDQKIKDNAKKIMEQMKAEHAKAEEQKKIIQAKIRAIQIQSLNKVAAGKKRPLENAQANFDLGDSQYSTFQARAEGRKKQKKPKKLKKPPMADPSLLETKKSKYSKASSRKPSSNSKKIIDKTAQKSKAESTNRVVQQLQPPAEQVKGPFFIWNIPILPEDVDKIDKKSKEVFMNVDRFNYKSGKTFREEANEYLAQKMMNKMEVKVHETKQQRFFAEVAKKKQLLDQEFAAENNVLMEEVLWNEDQVFRPNILENFHFFTKEASI